MTEVQFAKQFLTAVDSKPNKYQPDHVFDPQKLGLRVPYILPKLSHPPHPLPPKSGTLDQQPPPPGSEPSTSMNKISITLKSSRNPNFTLHLPSLPPSTPISSLKTHIQTLLRSNTAPPLEKIKILHQKKPIPSTKETLADVLDTIPGGKNEIEFGVMVMGGAPDPTPQEQTITLSGEPESATGEKKNETLQEDGDKMDIVDEKLEKVVEQSTTTLGTDDIINQKPPFASDPVQPGDPSGTEILSTKEFWDDLQHYLEQRLKSAEEAERLRKMFEQVAGI